MNVEVVEQPTGSFSVGATPQCALVDNAFGVFAFLQGISEGPGSEVEACLNILLASQFLSLNACPPPAPAPGGGSIYQGQ